MYLVKIEDVSYKFSHMSTLSSASYYRCTAMHATVEYLTINECIGIS